ncbi:MAG: single-stranded-DNA-specific exonuclease RecJ [Candidatus Margulisbacteria bacterium]|nr:single-stranded-DNA-specific exonuclease RecJ [Candidatus Margulisiibacteriota bacterium]
MDKIWQLYKPEKDLAAVISQELRISPFIAQILINRGIKTASEADAFLNPRLAQLRDPMEIPNISAAAKRVILAKERGDKVVVFGDYDVDGVTGTAIMVHTLKFLGLDVSYYIPHRYGEGYGLSLDSVKKIAESGAGLIITVDCGIASVAEIEAANNLDLDVIVTDHHNLPKELPRAYAVVNPKQIAGEHPSKYLSGAGVAFKFAWALLRTAGIKDSSFLTSLLDLTALGTFSDVVPLTGENRILAVGGLNLINEKRRPGIRLLAEEAALNGRISANQIYFCLAPRINAAGRLEHASKSVELMLSDDPLQAREMARELNRINVRRQSIGSSIKEEVFSAIDESYIEANKLIILAGENWHPGVIGIVASQVVDAFSRPTVLIGINDGVGRGSARSIYGLSIYEVLDTCRDLFLDFGGHEGAAGFEVALENIPELKRRLKEKVEASVKLEALAPRINVECEIEPAQITLSLIKEIERIAPFGEGNAAPIFLIRNLSLADHRGVGKDGKHLKAWFSRDGIDLETIGFNLGSLAKRLDYDRTYDIIFRLESNEFNGFESAQLSLIDFKEAKR